MRVVDASVALKWFRAEAGSAEASALILAEPLIAPELIFAETLNAAWKAVRRGQMTSAQADILCAELPSCVERFTPLAPLAAAAARIARILDHPVYDCFYLALAEREDAPVVTADLRLVGRVADTMWADLVIPLQTGTQ